MSLHAGNGRPYKLLALEELLMRIAYHNDRDALAEFHDHRPVFRFRDGQTMLFIQFITWLSETPWARRCAGWDRVALEQARDAVVGRFTLWPDEEQASVHRAEATSHGPRGYRSFLQAWTGCAQQHQYRCPLQRELESARILQRVVVSQFRFACLESRRQGNPARTRYAWQVKGGTLHLWLPAWKHGHERRRWLQAHAGHLDTPSPREQRRVQAIVDNYLGAVRHVPLSMHTSETAVDLAVSGPFTSPVEQDISVRGLAAVVADEKAERIHEQRPSIRVLGKATLKRLITCIFELLSEERYDESRVALSFGLSKPTMSRFAGIRWGRSGRIPDLWANLSQTLANHSAFVEAAQDVGVWRQVREVLDRKSEGESQRGNDV